MQNPIGEFAVNLVFSVEIVISNKPQARDPEGETIARDLIHKSGFDSVKEVRTGKLLAIKIEAADEEAARNKALLMCNDLRLYNPVAHSLSVRVRA
jgi:phosphoribosylformylglycinamidine synthase PurS subunit